MPVICIFTTVSGSMMSCSDDWDSHYEGGIMSSSQSLLEVLQQKENLSTFAQMVKRSGYESLLASSQTFTVWAPMNEALSDIDLNDELAVRQTVENHVGRFSYPLSAASETTKVRMLNGKRLAFSSGMDGLTLDGALLVGSTDLANNGLLHTLKEHVLYRPNFYEYIAAQPNCSKLYNFLSTYQQRLFDVEHSIELDVDNMGRPVYDSVFVNYNVLLQDERLGLGDIQNEDSVYTMLIPDDEAWMAAYQLIYPAFKVNDGQLSQEQLDSIQDVQTQLAILENLFIRGQVDPSSADSVITTTGSVMKNVHDLFGNTVKVEMSNGTGYVCNRLNYDNTQTWSKPIVIEAEVSDNYEFQLNTTSVYPRLVAADNPVQGISGNSYLEVTPVRTTAAPAVEFKLPEVLSGEDEQGIAYNIYVVVVPALVEGENMASDSTKVQFTLYYNNGTRKTQLARSSELETSGSHLLKLEAFNEFRFPVSDYCDRLRSIESNYSEPEYGTFTLSATTTIKSSNKNYTRNFRIDCIILEPIKKVN